MRTSKRGIVSLSIIFLAFFLGTTTQTGFSFGNKIFSSIGIPPLSNGDSGLHYATIISLIILIVGGILAKTESPPRRIGVLLLFLFVLSPMIVSITKPLYFKMHNGLGAIEYEYDKSHFDIRSSSDNTNLDVIGTVVLTNYGNNKLNIRIKISSNGYIQRKWFSNDLILTGGNTSEKSGIFTIHAGETRYISVSTTIPSNERFNVQGTINAPNIILSTDNETKLYGRYL